MANESKDDLEGFHDPLENYDPKKYDDPIEQALAEQTVSAIQSQPFATVSPDTTIEEAVDRLAGLHVACLLVVQDGKLQGVFTDRNVLDCVALEYAALKDKGVQEVMTKDPVFVFESDEAAAALSVMAVSGYRHVPVVGTDEGVVGIVSPQRVTRFLKQQFDTVADA